MRSQRLCVTPWLFLFEENVSLVTGKGTQDRATENHECYAGIVKFPAVFYIC